MEKTFPFPLTDSAAAERWFRRASRRWWPRGTDLRVVSVERLGSVQAERYILRYAVTLRIGKKSVPKTVYANIGPRRNIETLWKVFSIIGRRFRTPPLLAPRPLAIAANHRVFFYESFAGVRVRDELEHGTLTPTKLRSIIKTSAAWLKKLHRVPGSGVPGRSMVLREPDYAEVLKNIHVPVSLITRLNTVFRGVPSRSLVQGDPHLANYIAGPAGTLALIDYSEAHRGHPLEDVGTYLAHLNVALRPFCSRSESIHLRRIVLETYFGKPVAKLSLAQRRLLIAFQARATLIFLKFTLQVHRRPGGDVARVISDFVRLLRASERALRSATLPFPLP